MDFETISRMVRASGVSEGERIITDNISRLRDGLEISDLGKKEENK